MQEFHMMEVIQGFFTTLNSGVSTAKKNQVKPISTPIIDTPNRKPVSNETHVDSRCHFKVTFYFKALAISFIQCFPPQTTKVVLFSAVSKLLIL
ncbi:hypothetical protein ACIQZG_20735 [Lysinibacillus sp. NPDC096418]|uniref:hypothetical protein n=1 Tax=Lysinibacillus sp. NPDC096418 TaxID=3364138 RepID=UPI0037F51946